MPDEAPSRWKQLEDAFTLSDASPILVLLATLLLGGVLAMYIRFLYRRTHPEVSGDSIAKVFPLLTMVTIAVIAVVKSSLALSLGLVGALSIVRFRAAIKDPEELVYLFLCIGVGLALGAVQVWLGLALVVVATAFVLVFDRFRHGARRGSGYLTVVGDTSPYFADGEANALARVQDLVPRMTVERCEIDGEEGQLRIHVPQLDANAAPALLAQLQTGLPGCQISYVNADRLP